MVVEGEDFFVEGQVEGFGVHLNNVRWLLYKLGD